MATSKSYDVWLKEQLIAEEKRHGHLIRWLNKHYQTVWKEYNNHLLYELITGKEDENG